MTFSLEVNAAVGLFGLVPLRLSQQQHPSGETPSKDKGVEEGNQQMPLRGCDKLAEILPAASSRPPAAFEALTGLRQCHRHRACSLGLPNKAGEEMHQKNLKEFQKGKFQSRTIQALLAPRCFWSLVKGEELKRHIGMCLTFSPHTEIRPVGSAVWDWFWHGTDVV